MQMHRAGRLTVLAACISWALAACDSTGATAPTPTPPAPSSPTSMPAEADEAGALSKQDVTEAEQARRAAQARLRRCQQRPEICVQSSHAGEPAKEDAAH
jgi:hypothetical protein